MKCKPLLMRQFTYCTVALIGGIVSVAGTNPAIARHPSTNTQPLLMAQTPTLEGEWRLANMTEPGSPMPMLPSQELTADFAKGRVSGSGGCNRFSGGFETKGDQLTIGPLASTFKACEPPVMQQETRFLTALQAAQRYEVNPDGLQIFYQTKAGTGVLRFVSRGGVRALW
jgi:heat shock protein HslJ